MPELIKKGCNILKPLLIIWAGGGEPTIYQKKKIAFREIVNLTQRNKCRFGLITNGVCFPNLKNYGNFEWVRVSLDAGTEKSYLTMKGKNCFQRVCANIKRYLRTETKNVGVGIVLQSSNLDELPLIFERWYPLWKKCPSKFNIQLRPIREYPEKIPSKEVINSIIQKINDFCQTNPEFKEFIKQGTNYQELKTEGRQFWLKMYTQKSNKAKQCYMPLLLALLRPNGDLYPCDTLPQRNLEKVIGNITKDSIAEIAKKQQEFAQNINPLNCPPCRYDKMNTILSEMLAKADKGKVKNLIEKKIKATGLPVDPEILPFI